MGNDPRLFLEEFEDIILKGVISYTIKATQIIPDFIFWVMTRAGHETIYFLGHNLIYFLGHNSQQEI